MRYPRLALVAVLAPVSVPAAWAQPQAELVLHFVEIGQGDCTLIESTATGWRWGADGDGVVESGEGYRFLVRIRQVRGMNGPARSYYPTTEPCFNGGASPGFASTV